MRKLRRVEFGRRGGRRVLVTMFVLSLVAAACGGGDTTEPGPSPTDGQDPDPAATAEPDEEGGLVVGGELIADADLWEAAQAEGGITLYSSVGEVRQQLVIDRFMETVGLNIELVRLAGGRLYERVQTEFGANQLAADVLIHSDRASVQDHADVGVFEPFCPLNAEQIPDDLMVGDCEFYASHIVPLIFSYNSALVDEGDAPRVWADILSDRFTDQIAVQTITAGGTAWGTYYVLRQQFGVEFWEQLAAQNPTITGTAAAAQEFVTRGEKSLSPISGTINSVVDSGAPILGHFPEDGAVATSSWTGLTSQAQNPNAAKVFLNWLYSAAGQAAIAESGDFAPIPGSPPPSLLGIDNVPSDVSELVLPESDPDFEALRDEWFDEWFVIFDFTPES